jgi:putative radical SAM enzyme (TIGR03279 family)
MSKKGIRILEVKRGSEAEEIGLTSGDQILTVNGHEISDELALKFYLSEGDVDLCVRRSNEIEEHFEAHLSDGTDLGILVEEFQTQGCTNSCLFCFVDQLPSGVRPALKIKDDDYRLSFLHGNYITLTNLRTKELDRIVEQRLSPLYVSVHTTDAELRTRILGRKRADDLDGKLIRLVRGGIRLHAQVVLMPGVNDGTHLEKTVFDLYRLYPGVQSVAIVPIGLSDHGKPKSIFAPVTPAFSRKVIRQSMRWHEQFRSQIGRTFAYLADEFYIQGGEGIPGREYYDDFAQIEDGVGMVRVFLDEFETEISRRRRSRIGMRGTLVTGRLFYPTLQRCIERFNSRFGSGLQVCMTENRFLGRKITVAGLLAGQDILKALKSRDLGDFVVIPHEAVSRVDGILIDDFSLKDLSKHIGKPVYSSRRTVLDFFRLLCEVISD